MLDQRLYIIRNRKPVVINDPLKWGKLFAKPQIRRIRQTYIGDVRISTAFLGINHNYGVGPAVLFETMIFGGARFDGMREYQTRCETHRQALAMHWKAVKYAKRINSVKIIRVGKAA